jgi:hypothetical protein
MFPPSAVDWIENLNIASEMVLFWTAVVVIFGLAHVLPSSKALSFSAPTTLSTSDDAAKARATMEDVLWGQAGKGRKKQLLLRKKQLERQEQQQSANHDDEATRMPDPLVPYDSIECVSLMTVKSETGESASCDSSHVMAEIRLKETAPKGENNTGPTTTASSTTKEPSTVLIDPRDLHQTSDYQLWMDLRNQVDVSASQFSVVLGTNYFTNRQQLLDQKVNSKKPIQVEDLFEYNDEVKEDNEDDDSNSSESSPKNQTVNNGNNNSNSAACAWGIKMEPLAYQQYKQVMSELYHVSETGMHILTHIDPSTGRAYTFGASPDGMVHEKEAMQTIDGGQETIDDIDKGPQPRTSPSSNPSGGLLEIKSLWGRRHKSQLTPFDHCPNRYYDQIQGQLAICNKDWCDLMIFIPPNNNGSSTGGGNKRKTKRRAKINKKQKNKTSDTSTIGKRHGRNYSIVRVRRNEKYWNETLLPALVKFCDEVQELKASSLA